MSRSGSESAAVDPSADSASPAGANEASAR